MALSPLQLNAGAGLLQNTGLNANADLTVALSAYTGTNLITAIDQTMQNGNSVLSNATMLTLQTLSTNSCPALADSVPYANITSTDTGFAGLISLNTNTYLGNGDLTKFVQVFDQATGYVNQSNQFISSASTTNADYGATYSNMDELITGGLSNVTTDIPAFAADLAKLGSLINLAQLPNWGTPLNLVMQLIDKTTIVPAQLQIAFTAIGIDVNIVTQLTNTSASVTDTVQKSMWTAMQNIRGDSLAQIMKVLGVTTTGLETVADLLNPVKIFPNSYATLQCPTSIGYVPIYANAAGSVNPILNTTLPGYALRSTDPGVATASIDSMSFITEGYLATANKALAVSLLQIGGITHLTLQQLATVAAGVNVTNQPLISALTQPVPNTVTQYYSSNLVPGGSGPNNSVVVCDLLGTPAGYNIANQLVNTNSNLANIDTANLLVIYQRMLNTVDGVYGTGPIIIPAGPGAGTYADYDTAITTGLVPVADTEIANLIVQYPNETANLNTNWQTMGNQITTETTLQSLAGISFSSTAANQQQAMMSFVANLPEYGVDPIAGSANTLIWSIANAQTFTGQCVIGCLTQGKNQALLSNAGINSGINNA